LTAAFSAAFPGITQNSSPEGTIDATSLNSFLTGSFATLFNSANWQANWSQASSTLPQSRISANQTVNVGATANNPAFAQIASAYVAISDLGASQLNQSAAQKLVTNALSSLSTGLSSLTDLQSSLGVTQAKVTTASSNIDIQVSLLTNNVTSLEKVDQATAATNLTNLQNQLEVAYSLTGQISGLKLINYLPVGS
jgi:flagellar hook-associated protein 3 FlgL